MSDRPVEKELPNSIAVLVFVVLGVALWFGYRALQEYAKSPPPPPVVETTPSR